MLDRVCALLGFVYYMSDRSFCHNIHIGMGHEVLACILDIPFEMHSEVVQQTRIRILQISPVVFCHEALLPSQVPAV